MFFLHFLCLFLIGTVPRCATDYGHGDALAESAETKAPVTVQPVRTRAIRASQQEANIVKSTREVNTPSREITSDESRDELRGQYGEDKEKSSTRRPKEDRWQHSDLCSMRATHEHAWTDAVKTYSNIAEESAVVNKSNQEVGNLCTKTSESEWSRSFERKSEANDGMIDGGSGPVFDKHSQRLRDGLTSRPATAPGTVNVIYQTPTVEKAPAEDTHASSEANDCTSESLEERIVRRRGSVSENTDRMPFLESVVHIQSKTDTRQDDPQIDEVDTRFRLRNDGMGPTAASSPLIDAIAMLTQRVAALESSVSGIDEKLEVRIVILL